MSNLALNLESRLPAVPLCHSVEDPKQPCRFSGVCHEDRQMNQSGLVKRSGQLVQIGEPSWGSLCWAYEQLVRQFGNAAPADVIEAQQERAAIQAEGAVVAEPAVGSSPGDPT